MGIPYKAWGQRALHLILMTSRYNQTAVSYNRLLLAFWVLWRNTMKWKVNSPFHGGTQFSHVWKILYFNSEHFMWVRCKLHTLKVMKALMFCVYYFIIWCLRFDHERLGGGLKLTLQTCSFYIKKSFGLMFSLNILLLLLVVVVLLF